MATLPPRPLPPCHQYQGFLDEAEHRALLDWTIANRERFETARLTGHVLAKDEFARLFLVQDA